MKNGLKKFGLVGLVTLALSATDIGRTEERKQTERQTVTYTIKKDDTLWEISKAFEISVGDLRSYNPGLKANRLKIGSTLRVPLPVIKDYLPKETSPSGVSMIKGYEKFRDKPYLDPNIPENTNRFSIGYGHQIQPGEHYAQIDEETASAKLKEDIKIAERAIINHVNVPLSQKEFDGLVSFVFNTGRLGDTTLCQKLNDGDYAGTLDELPIWNKSCGVVLNGLIKRRDEERSLMLAGLLERDPNYFKRLQDK
ncbi:MAG: glycoside hydrolase family protein [Candidatus Pacearchaeota archaeon]